MTILRLISGRLDQWGWLLLAASIPLSNAGMSIALMLLSLGWITRLEYDQQLLQFWRNKTAVLWVGLYILHLVGVTYSDLPYALKDLRIKLPIFLIPFLAASSQTLDGVLKKRSIGIFVWAVLLASFIGTITYLLDPAVADHRTLSPFGSHVRLALMLSMALVFIGHGQYVKQFLPGALRWVAGVWIILFLVLLQSLTGWILMGLLLIYFLFVYPLFYQAGELLRHRWIKWALLLFLVGTGGWVMDIYRNNFIAKPLTMPSHTTQGHPYETMKENGPLENGYPIWENLVYAELAPAWEKRSHRSFEGNTYNQQRLDHTLIRFLTSKGWAKDGQHVGLLSDAEIQAIERGIANQRYMDGMSLSDRFYEVMWQAHTYRKGNVTASNSLTQRLQYLKVGWHIFSSSPLTGVGTGDIPAAYRSAYEGIAPHFPEQYRLRAHNQYLSFFITFGCLGGTFFLLVFFHPLWRTSRPSQLFWLGFLIIALSFLSEDTLETQAGVTFCLFFYFLLLVPSNADNVVPLEKVSF